jgi:hypothetical protein
MIKKFNRYYLLLLLMTLVYVGLVIKLPTGNAAAAARYGMTLNQARALTLTIVLPYALIWLIAFYGFIKVKQYAAMVGKSKDGKALRMLSDGLMLLAISLPLGSILTTLRAYINNQHKSLIPTTTIAYNYISLLLALAGVWLVAQGARKLAGTLDKKPYNLNQTVFAGIFTAFCIGYTYVTLTDPARRVPGELTGTAAYYLPDYLMFATIVVPYIVLWYLGFRAAYHVQLYRKNAPGLLYRKALGYLAAGIAGVVLSMMVLRFTASMSSFLSGLSLRFLLIFIYFLLILIGVGFGLIARGAKRLKKIEEV